MTDRCIMQPDSPSGPTPHTALAPSYAAHAATLGPTSFRLDVIVFLIRYITRVFMFSSLALLEFTKGHNARV